LKKAAEGHGWSVIAEAIVPDDLVRIQETIRSFSSQGCGLILTTGGTGIAERDVTPEAVRGIMRVEIPGFGEVMRMKSLELTPNAILSRSLAAVVDRSLVIALPGKPQGAIDCLGFVLGAIPHSVKLAQRVPTSC
jgi:molybdopterin adenylyltransferase